MSSGRTIPFVLTIIGPDRPGIVEAISAAVTRHGANWEESRMARLASRFAGILRVSVAESSAAALRTDLEALSSSGLRVICDPSPEASLERGTTLVLQLIGNDRPGIVREISRALAERNVNIEELETECISAAESGQHLFKASARLQLPSSLSASELRKVVERIAADLMVDIELAEAES